MDLAVAAAAPDKGECLRSLAVYGNYSDIYVLFAVIADGIGNVDEKELDIIDIGVDGSPVLRQGRGI